MSTKRPWDGPEAKRAFDLIVASLGLLALWPIVLTAWIAATASTGENGWFVQRRVGRDGRTFDVYKLRTMRSPPGGGTTVTARGDARITPVGARLRAWKLDELPQLVNVVKGDMSFVGPRPDVPGFADALEGEAREILRVRPGITSPATLKYRDEESILANRSDPETYNAEVIFPDKVRMNLAYVRTRTFMGDLRILVDTVLGRSLASEEGDPVGPTP
ncbi:MAG: sugar transferase [Trueperaceae bacterium]|nr:sugar transferase [Trueperaceae bacterium]